MTLRFLSELISSQTRFITKLIGFGFVAIKPINPAGGFGLPAPKKSEIREFDCNGNAKSSARRVSFVTERSYDETSLCEPFYLAAFQTRFL